MCVCSFVVAHDVIVVFRKQWKDTSKPLSLNRKNRCVLMKKKSENILCVCVS